MTQYWDKVSDCHGAEIEECEECGDPVCIECDNHCEAVSEEEYEGEAEFEKELEKADFDIKYNQERNI